MKGKSGWTGALSQFAPKPFTRVARVFTVINTVSSFEQFFNNGNALNLVDFTIGSADIMASLEYLGRANPYVSAGAVLYSIGRISYDFAFPSYSSSNYYYDNSSMTMKKNNW